MPTTKSADTTNRFFANVPFAWYRGDSDPLNPSLRQGSSGLPPTDPSLIKSVLGNQPEQISLDLSNPDAIWVTWISGIKDPLTQKISGSFILRLILLHICFVVMNLVAKTLGFIHLVCALLATVPPSRVRLLVEILQSRGLQKLMGCI